MCQCWCSRTMWDLALCIGIPNFKHDIFHHFTNSELYRASDLRKEVDSTAYIYARRLNLLSSQQSAQLSVSMTEDPQVGILQIGIVWNKMDADSTWFRNYSAQRDPFVIKVTEWLCHQRVEKLQLQWGQRIIFSLCQIKIFRGVHFHNGSEKIEKTSKKW